MDELFCRWSEKYVTRIPIFDEEHKEIFEIMNGLAAAVEGGGGDVYERFAALFSAYRKHVRSEESLLLKHNYIGLDKQKRDHANFLNRLETVDAGRRSKETTLTIDGLAGIRDEIVEHILGADKAYGEFLKSAGFM